MEGKDNPLKKKLTDKQVKFQKHILVCFLGVSSLVLILIGVKTLYSK